MTFQYDPSLGAASPPAHPPFSTPADTRHSHPTSPSSPVGGWEAEPAYVREQAAALAAEQAQQHSARWGLPLLGRAASPPPVHTGSRSGSGGGGKAQGGVDIFWHSSHQPSTPAATKQARAGSRPQQQKKKQGRGEALLPGAPAFGQGALTKWH